MNINEEYNRIWRGITYLNEVTEYKLNGILIKDKFSLPNGIFNKVLYRM